MWNLKHDISPPKFVELIISTELKGDTILYLKNFYNNIKMCLNVVTKLREYLLPDYQPIKRNSEFEEYFIPDRDHSSYSWNIQINTSLGYSLLGAMTNDNRVKSSMETHACKVFSTYDHGISGWTIISRLLLSPAPHLVGTNGDVQSDLSTLALNNG